MLVIFLFAGFFFYVSPVPLPPPPPPPLSLPLHEELCYNKRKTKRNALCPANH